MDLLYEESKRGELVTTDVENRLRNLEKRLEEKNKELAKLYTENIRLENVLRRYEKEFETLSKMPIIPFEHSEPTEQAEQTEYNEQVEPDATEENTVEQEVQQTETKKKRKVTAERREYMREYLHNYRKNKTKAEKEMNINV